MIRLMSSKKYLHQVRWLCIVPTSWIEVPLLELGDHTLISILFCEVITLFTVCTVCFVTLNEWRWNSRSNGENAILQKSTWKTNIQNILYYLYSLSCSDSYYCYRYWHRNMKNSLSVIDLSVAVEEEREEEKLLQLQAVIK